ncbi:mRNA-decapping enzyme subunit 1, putative [Plasmodium relictum]|uniref:mRNA-decapping enzyme subunit 1, putative n=1 Tax=Plasmodium relictum TaxID=85471 RepID=A0A1J1H359_PLARL|nr:mRNA-decapping enzyme subunit 1, putative [Plasmodium relictum]CRG99183.1 mRNA-decapping enzyme subunit 1, putative [Plasmodium relictum]
MKKKNNISTNYGKLKGRFNRYDMNGSYNFNENKKGIGNNLVNDLKNYRNEENYNHNNSINSLIGHTNANVNYNNGNNNYYSHNYKYNKNSYPYDYNSYHPKKIYEYKEKFKNSNHNNNAYNNNTILENRNNMSTLNSSNISNKINKESDGKKSEGANDDSEDENNKSNDDENINEEVSLLREKICFKMLKSIDIYITEIIMKSCFVTVYKMKEDELKWTRADIEGFLYIVRRSVTPFYRLIITNKKNEKHLLQDINANINLSTDQNYIFYRIFNEENNTKSIYSLWFYSTEEKEKIYKMLEELVEKACQEKNYLDNNSKSSSSNYNKNVNFIFTKNNNMNDNMTVVTKTEENLKNLNNFYSKKEDNKINKSKDIENNINNNVNNSLILKNTQSEENSDNVLKKSKSNNNYASIKSNSTSDNKNENNFDLAHIVNDIDYMRTNKNNDNIIYDNYTKCYYNKNNSINGNVTTNKNINGDIGDLNSHNISNKKTTYCNKNTVDYSDKAGRKLLYLIKGLSTEYEKENENKKLPCDEYVDNENSDTLNINKNKIEERGLHLQNEINAKKGGEAIMSLLGLNKNNELKDDEKKKKKKGKNANGSINNNNNIIINSNLKKNERQILLNNKDNSNSKLYKYYKNNYDSSEEMSVSNKEDTKSKELLNKNSFENYKDKDKEKLNNCEDEQITSLLDIIKLKSDKISMNNNNNNNNNSENDILNSYNTDSYNVLLKMQNKIESDDKKIINILDSKKNIKKDNYTNSLDNKDQMKYNNNTYDGHNNNKFNDVDYKNKSITLNRNVIRNIIKETLQSDEFVDLLWKKLTMNTNFI